MFSLQTRAWDTGCRCRTPFGTPQIAPETGARGSELNKPIAFPLHPADIQGLGRLAIDGVIGVTDLVEHLHAGIAGPHRAAPVRTRGLTRRVYGSVRGITRLVGGGIDLALWPLGRIRPATSSPMRDDLRAAINGVLGDHLAETNNPLAIESGLFLDGERLTAENMPVDGAKVHSHLVIFLHGLCMHPRHWVRDGLSSSLPERVLGKSGRTVLHFHYNSGRNIDTNGQALADALTELQDHWPIDLERISLVGHSMGGLVARSAAHHGTVQGQTWTAALSDIVTLGSPHHGAPLERAGHMVDRVLDVSRYTRPFTRLGAIRSQGIIDLRHGQIVPATPTPALPDHTRLHLVAASRAASGARSTRGDGLVPVASALAEDWEDSIRITRRVVERCGHVALMHHDDVADHLDILLDD